MCEISFIIPCYKSAGTIKKVIGEISETVERMAVNDYEIIAVDDCSPDNVFDVLKQVGHDNSRIKALRFSKNFGQHSGMIAGVQHSKGSICVFLDDDGQCPIDHLTELLTPLNDGFDVSIAEYGRKKQSLFKNVGSSFNELVANILTDKPKHIQMGNFMAFKRFVADEMARYSGPYPYISGLMFRTSIRIINVPMQERTRMEGETTYTFRKLVSLWIDSFTAFSMKPLRAATIAGLGASFLGVALAIFTITRKIIRPSIAAGWSSIIAIMLLIGGLILFVLGIIGEYIGRIYMTVNETPQYVIAEKYNI